MNNIFLLKIIGKSNKHFEIIYDDDDDINNDDFNLTKNITDTTINSIINNNLDINKSYIIPWFMKIYSINTNCNKTLFLSFLIKHNELLIKKGDNIYNNIIEIVPNANKVLEIQPVNNIYMYKLEKKYNLFPNDVNVLKNYNGYYWKNYILSIPNDIKDIKEYFIIAKKKYITNDIFYILNNIYIFDIIN